MKTLKVYAVAAAVLTLAGAAYAKGELYSLERAVTLPSTNTDWDYVKLDPQSGRLFVARRKDGLSVFDVRTQRLIKTIENSVGANGPLLLPEFNRGYVAMTDGSVLIFDLKALRPIDRVKLDAGGLNGAVYEPTTKRVHVLVGARPDKSTWYHLDAPTGRLLGKTEFASKKMDDPAADGRGHLYAPLRDQHLVLKLRASDLKEEARFSLGPCKQPVSVEYDHHADRLLLGCRGDAPVFLALDPGTGAIVGQVPIGRGVDGLALDETRNRIVTTNGGDATMTLIRRRGPDDYVLEGSVSTRPRARTMQLDPTDGRVFTVTANFTLPAADEPNAAPPAVFHPNSFTILTYRPN
ncbi:hypothetical protein [Phenylobacterium sp.]|uniref:YncE family protein n=1 Tax=Phenylobacterium sp. TaxID=1871053 RepID=UPI002EDA50AB